MPDTIALSPALGVEVVGVDRVPDDGVIGRCLEALKWRGVLLIRGLHLDDEAHAVDTNDLHTQRRAWTTQERFCYNTGILHRALPYDPSSERTLHRTTIAGDEAWA
jgi:hypothetical protein